MKLKLISIANKMPAWVEQGYTEFAKRLPRDCQLELVEVSLGKRGKNADIKRLMQKESEQMLAKVVNTDHVVALDVLGKSMSTPKLASKIGQWQASGQNIALLVGGPEGLHPDCLARANEKWSLSELTMPHPIVRIVVAEAIYRAWSVTVGHPYHRE